MFRIYSDWTRSDLVIIIKKTGKYKKMKNYFERNYYQEHKIDCIRTVIARSHAKT